MKIETDHRESPALTENVQVPERARRSGLVTASDLTQRFGLIGLWIIMIGIYAALQPEIFLRASTFQTIFNSQATLLFLTAGLLCTIIVGEFVDLSIAANMGLAATLLPVLSVEYGWSPWAAALAALAASTLVGVVNGVLIVHFRINTIVVTRPSQAERPETGIQSQTGTIRVIGRNVWMIS